MACVTIPVEKSFKERLAAFPWINWSKVGSEETMKKEIFEEFIKTGAVSEENQKFCDSIGWDPIDELEVRGEYIEKLKKIEKEPHSRMTLEKLDKLLSLK